MLALLRLEEEDRRRAPLNSVLNLLEPVVLIGFTVVARWVLDRLHLAAVGGNPVLFYATGYFANYLYIYTSRAMRSVDRPQKRFPIESRLDHILIHIIVSVLDYIVLGIVGFGILLVFVTAQALPYDFVPIVQAFLATVMLGFGMGVLNLVISKALPLWRYIFPVLNRVSVLLSGVMYIPDFLSPNMREVLSYNPMLHAIALFRTGFYPNYPTLLLDTNYLFHCACVAVIIGLVLERVTRRAET